MSGLATNLNFFFPMRTFHGTFKKCFVLFCFYHVALNLNPLFKPIKIPAGPLQLTLQGFGQKPMTRGTWPAAQGVNVTSVLGFLSSGT